MKDAVKNTRNVSQKFQMPWHIVAVGALNFTASGISIAASLAPPPYVSNDRHQVNMASGQVSPELTDLIIGDANIGLVHSVSTFSSNLVNYESEGPLGFRDKYYGWALKSIHHKPIGFENDPNKWIYVMRAFDVGGTFDFLINTDGTYSSYDQDTRHTLVFSPSIGLIWTKPDGTVTTFGSTLTSYNAVAAPVNSGLPMSKVVYPNGFTLTGFGAPIGGVTTNTGYQLKYVYVQNNTSVPNDDPNNHSIPAANSVSWSHTMPRFIVGINNAVDYCVPTGTEFHTSVADACPSLTKSWPTVTYTWPDGMPRGMYLADTSVKVKDAMGAVTEFLHRPYAKPISCNDGDPNYRVPRLIGIKSAMSNMPIVNYDYKTNCTPVMDWGPAWLAGPVAQVSTSTIGADSIGYTIGVQYQYEGQLVNGAAGTRPINRVLMSTEYGIWETDSWDKTVTRERSVTNRLLSIYDKIGGVNTEVGYDARRNVNSIKKNGAVIATAGYPATCSNRKTCNQATWIKDANGNQTDYEYDPNSGQVTRIKLPADANAIRPEIRNTYEAKYAYYKNASGAFQKATSPIYLLTTERRCISSATKADGSGCVGGVSDEVTTRYDYGPASGPNNLQLRGVVVSAYVGGAETVHRTCYTYDIYGNRIGETTANAGLASCN